VEGQSPPPNGGGPPTRTRAWVRRGAVAPLEAATPRVDWCAPRLSPTGGAGRASPRTAAGLGLGAVPWPGLGWGLRESVTISYTKTRRERCRAARAGVRASRLRSFAAFFPFAWILRFVARRRAGNMALGDFSKCGPGRMRTLPLVGRPFGTTLTDTPVCRPAPPLAAIDAGAGRCGGRPTTSGSVKRGGRELNLYIM